MIRIWDKKRKRMLTWNILREKPLWKIDAMWRAEQRYVVMLSTDHMVQKHTVYQGDILMTEDGNLVAVRYGTYPGYIPEEDRYENEHGFYLMSLSDESGPMPVEAIDTCMALVGNEYEEKDVLHEMG